jgi:hypothetical protein
MRVYETLISTVLFVLQRDELAGEWKKHTKGSFIMCTIHSEMFG